MIKRFKITGVSKKFKGVQKLKPQKTPSRFTSVMSDETVKANQRKLLGDLPEFMGLSQRATGDLAAESVALKTMNKKFFKTFLIFSPKLKAFVIQFIEFYFLIFLLAYLHLWQDFVYDLNFLLFLYK